MMLSVHVLTLPRVACPQHLTFAQLGVVLTEERFIYVPLEPRHKPVSSNATIRLLQVHPYIHTCIAQAPLSLIHIFSVGQLTGMGPNRVYLSLPC